MSDWPDVEGGLRTWLRADAALVALVGNRVFFGVPRGAVDATFPLVTVQRIGGGQDPSEAPVDLALMQFECWGTAADKGGKAVAWAVVNALRSRLETMRDRTTLATGIDAFGAEVVSVVWAPDPADDRPRYTLTVEVTGISS